MSLPGRPRIVLLGMMTRIPVAGAIWGAVQYLLGLQRLGYDVYYVEAHARTPTMLMERDDDDSAELAATFIARIMRRFDLADKWAFHALHDDGRCFGMTDLQLRELYRSADLLINYHGGTVPLPEHIETGKLLYLETDPVEIEIEVYHNLPQSIEFLDAHASFFTWGLNYGQPDCRVPVPPRFGFKPSCPVVIEDIWRTSDRVAPAAFTTIGNWRQPGQVEFEGEVYTWSKHHEFLKIIDLPRRREQPFELALSSYEDGDRRLLENHGWQVRHAMDFSTDLNAYRRYICESRGELTVAKDQNVRLRSGWFSERSAQYLAAGRPVITQDTGFGNVLPTGRGLFAFSTMDDILAAVDAVNSDYELHRRAASELAREYFNYDVVLPRMLAEVGL
jgi:hypothetical protein